MSGTVAATGSRASEAELFDGRVWTGDGALRPGLIDGLGEARATIRARFGKDARLALANPRRGSAAPVALAGRACAYVWTTLFAVAGGTRPLAQIRRLAAGAVEQMFTFSFSKLLMTALVAVVAWRGWRIYQQMQARLAAGEPASGAAQASAAQGHRSGRVRALRDVRAERHDLPQRRGVPVSPRLSSGRSP